MYVSQYNRIDALDARTGNVIWQYQRQPIATGAQRGTGFWNNKLYVTTSDKHLLALDARNGSVLWDVAVHDGLQLAGQAPLIVKGKLIVSGNQPHGFIQAYDADTGKYLWSWSPIPAADDPQLASWGGQKPDGMPIWVSGSYDPELNLDLSTAPASPSRNGPARGARATISTATASWRWIPIPAS